MPSKKTLAKPKTSAKFSTKRKTSPAKKISHPMTRTASAPSKTTEESVDVYPINSPSRRGTFRRPYLIAAVGAIVLLGIIFLTRSFFVAALVNGQPISRWKVISALEKQGGKQALQGIVTDTVIKQEADRRHITVSQSEVNSQIKTIESNLVKQGQSLDAALQYQGMTRQDLNDRIMLQKLVEKMVGPVTVTDKEVKDYMDKNKDSLPAGATDASIRQQLQQQKLQAKEQTFVQGLQSKAKINYWVSY